MITLSDYEKQLRGQLSSETVLREMKLIYLNTHLQNDSIIY